MPQFILTNKGKIEWRKSKAGQTQHVLTTKQVLPHEKEFLLKHGLSPTIFNVSNLQQYQEVPMFPYYAKLALLMGAEAQPEVIEKINKEYSYRFGKESLDSAILKAKKGFGEYSAKMVSEDPIKKRIRELDQKAIETYRKISKEIPRKGTTHQEIWSLAFKAGYLERVKENVAEKKNN